MLQRPTALVDYSDSESDESEEASDVLMHDTTRQSTAVDAGDPRRGSSAEHLDSKPDAIAGISVVSLSDIGHGTIGTYVFCAPAARKFFSSAPFRRELEASQASQPSRTCLPCKAISDQSRYLRVPSPGNSSVGNLQAGRPCHAAPPLTSVDGRSESCASLESWS